MFAEKSLQQGIIIQQSSMEQHCSSLVYTESGMQPYEYTDEELVHMTTVQLRNLLEQHIISPEQHHEFRSRRRRLQNRKYARRCAKKKQTEVAELTYATQNESSAIKVRRSI
ncbi:unnamed protein product [Dibothriocephalus latus]|uniref:Basic leucine zipper domain-containing protein n=1 Tax=Dibothriocephalus latus TaxID=60516 RepID=A0A3P7LH92_DIBLA|nr:unnamed protein product [Dibothriocephalus latus]